MTTGENAQAVDGSDLMFETANERLKTSFSSWFWGSMVVATISHFLLMNYWPELEAADMSIAEMAELEAIDIPPEIEIPPAPQAIARPANPVVTAGAQIDDNVTIAPTTFEQNVIVDLPPPPVAGVVDVSAQPMFVPRTVDPSLRNSNEVLALLQREYPPLLKAAGVEGQVIVDIFIDETGKAVRAILAQSSGYTQFDEVAQRVALTISFNPAMNRDDRVAVWVRLPIGFAIQR